MIKNSLKIKNLKFKIITIGIAFYLVSAIPAYAQELRTFTIVPPAVEKTLDGGNTTEGIMKIVNDSNETITFTASVRDYIVEDAVGSPKILPPNTLSNKYSASSWIGITPSTFTIKPHEKQELNYYIQIPADARPGGHYAAVLYSPEAAKEDQTGASVETHLGTLFYLTVNGRVNEFSRITQFFANNFQEYGPVKVSTQIQNSGDLHIKPDGQITVSDLIGREIGKDSVSQFNIFPGATRLYENTFGQKLMIGRFKAQLTATYGKSNKMPLMSTVYFWVFPWKITLVGVLAIIAVVLGIMNFRKGKSTTQKNAEKNTD